MDTHIAPAARRTGDTPPTGWRRDTHRTGTLSELLSLLLAGDAASAHSDAQPVLLHQVLSGETLFHQGAEAQTLAFVSVGTFKLCTTAEDGYQQVIDFAERADVLGFDALDAGRHPTTVHALEDSWVYTLAVPDLLARCHEVPALNRALHRASSRQLAKRSELADVMAAVAAEVRLARFLVHMAAQMESLGRSPRRFVLRMCRRDLASHLGVAHETVSRSFSMLAYWGCIRVSVREVEIIDEQRLRAVSRCTRGILPESVPAKAGSGQAGSGHAHRVVRAAQHSGAIGHA